MLIEIGQLALSVVTLLLQRLDKHRDDVRHSSDLQAALLTLSESLGRWAQAADATNREPWRVPSQIPMAMQIQTWLDKEGSGDTASTQAVLATYAPELREQLGRVAAARVQQLKELEDEMDAATAQYWSEALDELEGRPTKGAAYRAELRESAQALHQAKRDLDAFIRETFPLGSGQVPGEKPPD
jgi:hypothetical protein